MWAPRADKPREPAPVARNPQQKWTDLDFIARANDHCMRSTFYGGEAFPVWNAGYAGHAGMCTFLGCSITTDMNTGWIDPILTDEELDVAALRLDPANRWWQFALAMFKRAAAESRGKAIPSIGAFGGCGDTLAALRGSERMLYDVTDRPDQVRAAERYLMELWCRVYDEFYAIIHAVAEGSTCWYPFWSPGKFYASSCDFAYMISPAMFSAIFLPVVERQTRFLDHCLHHVDGVGNFAHVPALCELPRLQAIEILPGSGKPSALHYLDTLKYVQRAGKNLQINLPWREVEPALKELSARGLMIHTTCPTEAEARALLENAKKWSRDRRV